LLINGKYFQPFELIERIEPFEPAFTTSQTFQTFQTSLLNLHRNFLSTKSFLSFAASMKELNDTGKRVLIQAHDLFMQYGLKSVSMDDIASKLGISKKTIYLYFQDKEHLVAEVVKHITQNNQQLCDIDSANSEDAIHEIFLAMIQMSKLFQTMNPSILYDLQKYYPKGFNHFLVHKNEYIYNKIKLNLIKGIKENLYRDDLDLEIITKLRVECIVMPFSAAFQNNIKVDLVRISQEITIHFLHGIVSAKGLKQILKHNKKFSKK
jgi:AcrR family transcriptional regulator